MVDGDPRILAVEENFDAHLLSLDLTRAEMDPISGVRAVTTWFEQQPLTDIIPIEPGEDDVSISWTMVDYPTLRFVYSVERFFIIADLPGDESFYRLDFIFSTREEPPLDVTAGSVRCDDRDSLDECLATAQGDLATAFIQSTTDTTVSYRIGNAG